MRSVSLMTWDLVKKEFNISAKKGESVIISMTENKIAFEGKTNIFILKAR